jgi:hypothetical protein
LVVGEMWRLQKGRLGIDMTYPQKINISGNNRFPRFPAASAVSSPATHISVNVPAKIKNTRMNKNMSPPLSAT